ncbi:bifunctional hydroxymethylpyrimidine kinase/phosphomethylpyrimidine kinase [Pedobacter heparinus]|uniref:bifunctional hydroxymethylpyrimidine kinase/phosphomethylpyrimidine kinase n=1 Tax=Pedobacter heparinus TaxID=984 RepID=UPI00292F56D3|nr:bifunctional hydroxymethylpyrimidine kinase/phosphomethylpyrimidine kinase [Pedobacter heparinus]
MKLIVISDPLYFEGEGPLINQLFEAGLAVFHLRKPGSGRMDYARLIGEIEPRFLDRIALHQFHELTREFPGIKRLHYPEAQRKAMMDTYQAFPLEGYVLSSSVHELDALQDLADFDYTFYGPVFDSLSKPGYRGIAAADFRLPASSLEVPLIALGGIAAGKMATVKAMGFAGMAVLGAIWADKTLVLQNFKLLADELQQRNRPYAMSIAGFDPSAGAGLLADIKCFEQHQIYGFGVCSALTVQTDSHFLKNQWLDAEQIIDQLAVLLLKFDIKACKIGLIKNSRILLEVVSYLRQHAPDIQIILDPVLKASAGYAFHDWENSLKKLEPVLRQLDLITPNYPEMRSMGAQNEVLLTAKRWAAYCPVLLKGGHQHENKGWDYLFEGADRHELRPEVDSIYQKHGSGCVLSAAITAQLAKGESLLDACLSAKKYTEKFLNSNKSLLGYHNYD